MLRLKAGSPASSSFWRSTLPEQSRRKQIATTSRPALLKSEETFTPPLEACCQAKGDQEHFPRWTAGSGGGSPRTQPPEAQCLLTTQTSNVVMFLLHVQKDHCSPSHATAAESSEGPARQVACSAAPSSLFGWHWKRNEDETISAILQHKLGQQAQEEILLAMRIAKHPSD